MASDFIGVVDGPKVNTSGQSKHLDDDHQA